MRHSAYSSDEGKDLCARDEVEKPDISVLQQARRYLVQHSILLVAILFALLCLDRPAQDRELEASPVSESQHGRFFRLLFNLISAYGNVGWDIPVETGNAHGGKLCATLSPMSQMLLCGAMFLGRIRGLPDAIDPSVIRDYELVDFDEGILTGYEPDSGGLLYERDSGNAAAE